MKLLFDENLSPSLAAAFQGEYPGSTHVERGNVSTVQIDAALREYREAIERLEADAGLATLIV